MVNRTVMISCALESPYLGQAFRYLENLHATSENFLGYFYQSFQLKKHTFIHFRQNILRVEYLKKVTLENFSDVIWRCSRSLKAFSNIALRVREKWWSCDAFIKRYATKTEKNNFEGIQFSKYSDANVWKCVFSIENFDKRHSRKSFRCGMNVFKVSKSFSQHSSTRSRKNHVRTKCRSRDMQLKVKNWIF